MSYNFQDKNTEVITPNNEYPVTLEEVKRFGNLDDNDEEDLLDDLIQSSTEIVEQWLSKKLMCVGVRTTIDSIGTYYNTSYLNDCEYGYGGYGGSHRIGADLPYRQGEIKLPVAPFYQMNKIEYRERGAAADSFTLWPETEYYYNRISQGFTSVRPRYDGQWPHNLEEGNAMRIEYVIGYGYNPNDVPAAIRLAIKELTMFYYEHRDGTHTPPPHIFNKLRTYKVIKGPGGA